MTPEELFTSPAFYHEILHKTKGKVPEILADQCKGCTVCIKKCPADAISGERKMPHHINPEKCTRCGECLKACKFDAVIERTAGTTRTAEQPAITAPHRQELVCHPKHQIAGVRIGIASCCQAPSAVLVLDAVIQTIREHHLDTTVETTGCTGLCSQSPILETINRQGVSAFYGKVQAEHIPAVLLQHHKPKNVLARSAQSISRHLETLWNGEDLQPEQFPHRIDTSRSAFLKYQQPIATKDLGQYNPNSLDEYRRRGGFETLKRCLKNACCPAGNSSVLGLRAVSHTDRMLLESFPFRIIEGMIIAAQSAGVPQGFLHIAAADALAAERIRWALASCYENRLLGENILDSGFSFELVLQEGMDTGTKPAIVHPAETYALLPAMFASEIPVFERIDTLKNEGTKIFALSGKVCRGGLIEVPMGTTIRQIVEDIGGGIPQEEGTNKPARTLKAVLIGGTSHGGCLPASFADTPVDCKSLADLGINIDACGLTVLDNTDCIVDVVRESLPAGRERGILERLCEGRAEPDDLAMLETSNASLVASSIRFFRREYEMHISGGCPAGKCSALIEYQIGENCTGCSLCVQTCPASAIPSLPYRRHHIDTPVCRKCDACRQHCPNNAVHSVRKCY